ncbi:MAG: carbohydrate-binding protein [Flavobacteriales bacterium]
MKLQLMLCSLLSCTAVLAAVVPVPGKIEAENYSEMLGIQTEVTADVGGGSNIGWTDDGDWLTYDISVANAGNFDFAFRSASPYGGVIRMEIDGGGAPVTVALPITGGWQTWMTTTMQKINLSAGNHVIKIIAVTGGFNMNYLEVSATGLSGGPGFLHAIGKNIVNNNGNFVMKAANIGNYMVQEGYMMNLGGGYQYVIKQKIADVVGQSNADKFYQDYYKNYLTKTDIDSLSKWGFNSIRLPMHYNLFTPLGQPSVFYESGFVMVDSVISWCKANNMYVILDLHAAPGGQNSGDISDYIAGQPSLWESTANRDQTVQLWKKFAERYVNEQYVGGYDLINETNWTIPGNTLLMNLMKDITAAIRTVDNNHIVFIEGNSYANDYSGLTPKWDNNMAYSFHKYWNDVSDASLNFIFSIRDGQNVPVWLGEFGENSNHWMTEAVALMAKHNIGWAVWPYKKMGSVSGMVAFKEPNNWSALADYINGGAKPSAQVGQAILNELLQNVKLSNCKINRDYFFALFPDPNSAVSAFASHHLPGVISAVDYDMGKNGVAYNDLVYQSSQFGAGGGSYTAWNTGWYYRNDGVDVQYSNAEKGAIVGWTEDTEWMQYSVDVAFASTYSVKIRAAGNGGQVSLLLDGSTFINAATVGSTAGWDSWQNFDLGNINLPSGRHTLRVLVSAAGYNISSLEFVDILSTGIIEEPSLCNVFPNPFIGETQLKISHFSDLPVLVKATDSKGAEVYSAVSNTNENIVFGSNLPSGIYVVQCLFDNKVQTIKLVKL